MAKRRTPFADLQKVYGLERPDQIKLNILFKNIKQLILAAYGNNAKNQSILQEYQDHWDACEKEEARSKRKNPPASKPG